MNTELKNTNDPIKIIRYNNGMSKSSWIRWTAISAFLAVASTAYADRDTDSHRHIPNLPKISKLSDCDDGVKQSRSQSPPTQAIQCGQTLTANTDLTADLSCPNTTGFALKIIGNNITVNGHGHQIIAPQAASGIYVQGSSDTIQDIHSNGITQGSGIFAYDSPGVKIENSDFSGNETGILLDAETTDMNQVSVAGNTAQGNSMFGIRTSQEGSGIIDSPSIKNNDFSKSGSYGMYIQAQSYKVQGKDGNSFLHSLDGIYLKDGSFSILNIALGVQLIQEVEILVDSAASFQATSLDVSTQLPPQPSQERIGLDLYRVAQFDIDELFSWNNDVGLKLTTEQGVSSAGTIDNSSFFFNTVAAIMVTSFDSTPFGNVKILHPFGKETSPAVDLLISPNTILGPQSVLPSQF
jgi:hypothetical protein